MFQPIRGIARTLLVSATLAAAALTTQSVVSGSAHANGNFGGQWGTVTVSGNYRAPAGMVRFAGSNWHVPTRRMIRHAPTNGNWGPSTLPPAPSSTIPAAATGSDCAACG